MNKAILTHHTHIGQARAPLAANTHVQHVDNITPTQHVGRLSCTQIRRPPRVNGRTTKLPTPPLYALVGLAAGQLQNQQMHILCTEESLFYRSQSPLFYSEDLAIG